MYILASGNIIDSTDIKDIKIMESCGKYGLYIVTSKDYLLRLYPTYEEANLHRISIMEGLYGEH